MLSNWQLCWQRCMIGHFLFSGVSSYVTLLVNSLVIAFSCVRNLKIVPLITKVTFIDNVGKKCEQCGTVSGGVKKCRAEIGCG